jgi:hypothetical protein
MSDKDKVAQKPEDDASNSNLPLPEGNAELAAIPTSKEKLYRQIASRLNNKVDAYFKPVAERVQKKHGEEIKMRQVFGDSDARNLVVIVWRGLFDILLCPGDGGAISEVNVGIPGGFGSLQLTTAGATKKKTPQGQVVDVQKRWRVKYSAGRTVDVLLEQLPPPPPDAVVTADEDDETPAPKAEAKPEAKAATK